MNTVGLSILNQSIFKGCYTSFRFPLRDLRAEFSAYIKSQTSVDLEFALSYDAETGSILIESDYEELSDEDYETLAERFENPQEYYDFTNVLISEMFNEDTYIHFEDDEDDMLGVPAVTIYTKLSDDSIKLEKADDESFAHVSWSKEDICASLQELGAESITDELVNKVMNYPRFEKTMQELMFSAGWNVLNNIVSEVLDAQ